MIEDLTEDQDEDVAGNASGIQFVLNMCGDDGSASQGRSLSLSFFLSPSLSPPLSRCLLIGKNVGAHQFRHPLDRGRRFLEH